jgi:hypothetical protein
MFKKLLELFVGKKPEAVSAPVPYKIEVPAPVVVEEVAPVVVTPAVVEVVEPVAKKPAAKKQQYAKKSTGTRKPRTSKVTK